MNALGGVTPIGPPQLLTGTTETMILFVNSTFSAVANTAANAGASIYRIDGGTGQIISAGVPYTGFVAGAAGSLAGGVLTDTIVGTTPWSVAPLTLDWDEATSAASIYGVAGSLGNSTGVSIWRRSSATLAAPNATGTTAFNQASGVSAVYAAPVISGNSLFVVAYHTYYSGGISVFQFDKRDLTAGGNNVYGAALNNANVIEPNSAAHTGASVAQISPTPVAQPEASNGSGGTLYVTDWSGGVTLYDTQDLSVEFAYDWVKSAAGVTASPVASSNRLLIPWTTSVSCFATNPGAERVAGGSGVSLIWQYDFDEGAGIADGTRQIWSTPIISNGYAWVTALDTVTGDSRIWRFDINDDFNGDGAIVSTEPEMYAAPIVVGDYKGNDDNENGYLWFCSYNPQVDRIDQSRWAEAEPYWAQFKADAAKTGENTLADPDDDDDFIGSSSGCFLSTIQ